jgi:hypothetical protein
MAKIKVGLLAFVLSVVLWFAYHGGRQYYAFARLKERTVAHDATWEILKLSTNRFCLGSNYSYTVQGKVYRGRTIFQKAYYLNEYSAKAALDSSAKQNWMVWYDPRYPEISSLQKLFPFKNLIRGGLASLLLIYFLAVNSWLKKDRGIIGEIQEEN